MKNLFLKKLLILYLVLLGAALVIIIAFTNFYKHYNLEEAGVNLTVFVLVIFAILIVLSLIIYFSVKRKYGKIFKNIADLSSALASGDYSILDSQKLNVNYGSMQEIASSISSMGVELKNNESFQTDFIANISHDFRTPLTSIKGYVSAIKDGTISYEDSSRYLDIVLNETNRLENLVEDLLKYNEWVRKNPHLDLQETVIDHVLSLACQGFSKDYSEKGIRLETSFDDNSAKVLVDTEKIMQVINNLLKNSLKYSPKDDVVTVSTTINDSVVYVKVHNNGPKISAENQEKIFDRFYKADHSRGIDKAGAGLGLSIAKDIISSHGEKIYIECDDINPGVSFIFTLKAID